MSAVWLKIAVVVSLFYTAQTGGETKGVVWRNVGEDLTFQCDFSSKQKYLSLKKGLDKESQLIFAEKAKVTVAKDISDRLQTDNNFPKISILIKNLTVSDTGPYWCVYNNKAGADGETLGNGSLLLVVTGKDQPCKAPQQNLVVVSFVITGAVLLCVFSAFIAWIIFKSKCSPSKKSSKRLPHNDVYEDMRGTLRH